MLINRNSRPDKTLDSDLSQIMVEIMLEIIVVIYSLGVFLHSRLIHNYKPSIYPTI